ncbi:hypothetical protein NDU88_004999 [Pleurodeles waltl]|uniref:Uncharacterized protein n=1 Tax=Pleurodeles waltl TaxID=8319 RepID=A0AAV7LMX2_PLEWA|nr:hypothetical protein NDU88_004999 [Pleurodeles waltl]
MDVDTLGALFQEGVCLAFEQLREEYDLPRGHFLTNGHLLAKLERLWDITDLERSQYSLIRTLHLRGCGRKLVTLLTRAIAHRTQDPLILLCRE